MLTNRYLTDQEIDGMAIAAVKSYEMSCDWNYAFEAAKEHAADEYGVSARRSACLLALQIAKTKWMAICAATRREMGAE